MTKTLYASVKPRPDGIPNPAYIAIVIHDDLESMRKAAKRHSPDQNFDGSLAVYNPQPKKERFIKVDGIWENGKHRSFAGTIRLAKDYVHTEIVTHEAVHAACDIYRRHVHNQVHLGAECNYREEALAYISGELIANIYKTLYEGGIIE